MGFRNDAWATVWKVEDNGKTTRVRLSVSRKVDGNYEQDFSGICLFISTAHAKAQTLKEKDRIKLKSVDVSSRYDKEKEREFITYKVFDYEKSEEDTRQNTAIDIPTDDLCEEPDEDENENDLPF